MDKPESSSSAQLGTNQAFLFDIQSSRNWAVFSECGTWRYNLVREWDESLPKLCLVMLNPSTADAMKDDPTTRRCLSRAREMGYGRYEAVNLFALRSVTPDVLYKAEDPVGPMNDDFIKAAADRADRVIVAWGVHGTFRDRYEEVCRLLDDHNVYCLGTTKDGHPRHPLYLRSDQEMLSWNRNTSIE